MQSDGGGERERERGEWGVAALAEPAAEHTQCLTSACAMRVMVGMDTITSSASDGYLSKKNQDSLFISAVTCTLKRCEDRKGSRWGSL